MKISTSIPDQEMLNLFKALKRVLQQKLYSSYSTRIIIMYFTLSTHITFSYPSKALSHLIFLLSVGWYLNRLVKLGKRVGLTLVSNPPPMRED